MYKHNNLRMQRFGRLLVLSEAGRTNCRHILWLCKCDCGTEVVVSGNQLVAGKTQSCGCYQRQRTSESHKKHGACGDHSTIDRLYKVWISMRNRCLNERCKDYKYYGGRGITICAEWNDYINFKEWAMANGYDPNAKRGQCTIDRIDVNGNYCPENCRWVSMKIQNQNKRKMDAEVEGC